jgi:polysaccharide export outer membrane protein
MPAGPPRGGGAHLRGWAASIVAGLLCVLLAACAGPAGIVPIESAAVDAQLMKAAVTTQPQVGTGAEYRLGPGDKLRIQVFNDKDLSREYEVGDNGTISMALVGQIKAAGLTVHELEESLRASLRNGYIKDPKLSVEVMNYRPFYIIGEVNKPGEYPFKTGLNVLSAIAIAGGHTYRGHADRVFIRRAGEAQERPYQALPTVPVFAGDVVRIPERYF